MSLENAQKTAKKWAIRIVVGGVLLGVGGSALYTWGSLHYTYSEGERVGFVQKVSEKGWLCKTYEGDLGMANIAGQPAQVFTFTVQDKNVVDQMQALAGRKVALIYKEHKGVPSTCFGDTAYFVTGVRKAE
jgi:hypothetical protein